MRKYLVLLLIALVAFIVGLVVQVRTNSLFAQVFTTGSVPGLVLAEGYSPNHLPAADLLFERVPGPDVPTLQEITAGASTDAEAIAMVVDYYHANHDRLTRLWREDNDTRLAGIFTMYVVHISTVYGETTYPPSFLEYLQQPRAHCGTYSTAQSHIADALGLTWRMYELTSGWHGWVEIHVDGQWEIFDATTNEWISRSARTFQQVSARISRILHPAARRKPPRRAPAHERRLQYGAVSD